VRLPRAGGLHRIRGDGGCVCDLESSVDVVGGDRPVRGVGGGLHGPRRQIPMRSFYKTERSF